MKILTEQPEEFFPLEELPDGRPTGIQTQGLSLLIFSPNSKMIAGASTLIHFPQVVMSGIIWLWDANTGRIKSTFHAPDLSEFGIIGAIEPELGRTIKEVVTSLAFSPNSRIFAVGAYGVISNQGGYPTATIQLYNIHTGERKFYSTGHTAPIFSMAFSPDGRTLISAGRDGTILQWDADIDQNKSIPVKMPDAISIPSPNISIGRSNTDFESDRTQLTNHQLEIKQICEERGITTLFHFTRIENLRTILQEGLLGRSILETWEQQPLFNDHDRADGYKEAVCLSISFPNYKMFWTIRREMENTKEVKDCQWIVLLLDARVLWELDCAFCYTNAASGVVKPLLSKEQIDEQKRPEALKNMFVEDYYDSIRKISINRQNLQIPKHYTTNPQAEVLVFDPISVKYIKEVHFYKETARKQWLPSNHSAHSQTFSSNRDYFYGRSDSASWKKETL